MFLMIMLIGTYVNVKVREQALDKEIAKIQENYSDVDVGIVHTVTFDANGGTVSPTTKDVKYNQPYGELPIPTKDGYEFAGWQGKNLLNLKGRTVKDGGGRVNTNARTFNGDGIYLGLTGNNYYLPSQINEYEIDEENNNISVNTKSSGYGVGVDVMVKPNTTYTISIGANPQGTSSPVILTGEYKKDGTYIKTNNHSRTFTTTEETYWLTITVWAYNNKLTAYNIQLEEGDTATEFEKPIIATEDAIVTNVKNHTLKAIWEKMYLVTFDANGGSIGTNSTETLMISKKVKDVNIPIRNGYTFLGYYNDTTMLNMETSISSLTSTSKRIGLGSSANMWSMTESGDKGDNISGKIVVTDSNLNTAPTLDFNDYKINSKKIEHIGNAWNIYFDFEITQQMLNGVYGTYRFIDLNGLTTSSVIKIDEIIRTGKKYFDSNGKAVENLDLEENTTLYAIWREE